MTMSDDVVVKAYADLISDSKLRGDDPDVVGRELQELGGDTDYLVAWLPDWLVDEKDVDDDRKERAEERRERREERDDPDDQDDRDQEDVELVGRSDNVVSARVDYETEKAYLVVVDGDEIWLPKSVIRVYRTTGDVDLEIPLTRLDSFASNGVDDDG